MDRKHQIRSAHFKAKVAIEALKGELTMAQIASKYDVHPKQVAYWRDRLIAESDTIFVHKTTAKMELHDPGSEKLLKKIGEQAIELDYLKKAREIGSARRRLVVKADSAADLSVRKQCQLLGVSRASFYREPKPETPLNLELLRLLDERFMNTPFFGRNMYTQWLKDLGYNVNHKRVQRLLKILGIKAMVPGPHTSRGNKKHPVYPYLLKDLATERPNQVWAADITYRPTALGYLYLVAVIDWFSRCILSWSLSNSLESDFCVQALEGAFCWGKPEIFNTDQGSQFTSEIFTKSLEGNHVAISMDGVGRCWDNIMVERLWRTIKYEEVYLKKYESGEEAHHGLEEYIEFYNHERFHTALGNRTPKDVYLSNAA